MPKLCKLTSNGVRIIKTVPKGTVLGIVFKKTNSTGYIDKDYQKTPFGSFLDQNSKTPNGVLSLNKKDNNIYLRTSRRVAAGEFVSVNFKTMHMLGKFQKDKKTDYLSPYKNDFESNRETELGNVQGNYLIGTNFGKSYNA